MITYFYICNCDCIVVNNANNGDPIFITSKFSVEREKKHMCDNNIRRTESHYRKVKHNRGKYLSVNGRTLIPNLTLDILKKLQYSNLNLIIVLNWRVVTVSNHHYSTSLAFFSYF